MYNALLPMTLYDPRGAARRAQMLRLQGVRAGYMAGAGRGRQAGLVPESSISGASSAGRFWDRVSIGILHRSFDAVNRP